MLAELACSIDFALCLPAGIAAAVVILLAVLAGPGYCSWAEGFWAGTGKWGGVYSILGLALALHITLVGSKLSPLPVAAATSEAPTTGRV